jgi:hypothetical protein
MLDQEAPAQMSFSCQYITPMVRLLQEVHNTHTAHTKKNTVSNQLHTLTT